MSANRANKLCPILPRRRKHRAERLETKRIRSRRTIPERPDCSSSAKFYNLRRSAADCGLLPVLPRLIGVLASKPKRGLPRRITPRDVPLRVKSLSRVTQTQHRDKRTAQPVKRPLFVRPFGV
ncbi:hypothetical protein VTK73DRAFT_2724 [Phialemonium thermophilum]|uniref:Uncharacterized protein n=1 Tax=Phialemonium thermophilum TaxID=223376 RepID=A0ABR3X367_9PEZI